MQPIRSLQHNSRGNVLVVGLFTLALLSLLGSAATTTSRTDVSITGNAKSLQEAFYAAEVGLTMGEKTVNQMDGPRALYNLPVGIYPENKHPDWRDMNWNDEDSILMDPLALPSGIDHLYERPRYTIEVLKRTRKDRSGESLVPKDGKPRGRYRYRIYAKGTGGSSKTQSVLQSIFATHLD